MFITMTLTVIKLMGESDGEKYSGNGQNPPPSGAVHLPTEAGCEQRAAGLQRPSVEIPSINSSLQPAYSITVRLNSPFQIIDRTEEKILPLLR